MSDNFDQSEYDASSVAPSMNPSQAPTKANRR